MEALAMQALLALALGTALTGIDVGWQPIEEGGLEYIVQIEPETLARLKPGDELATGIRPVLRDVRRYRIVIGKGPLPRIALPESPAAAPSNSSQPRLAPMPLATAVPERSIVVPAEPGGAAPPVVPPPARIAVAPRPATTVAPAPVAPPITQPPAAAPAPTAPSKLPGKPVVGGWQAAGAAKAAEATPRPAPTSPPAATLKLEEPKINPPDSLQLKQTATLPKAAAPAAAAPAPVKKEGSPPAFNLGDRYRNVEPGTIEDNPANRLKPTDVSVPPTKPAPPVKPDPAGDRYRDLLAPPATLPKAPADDKGDPSADAAKPAAERIVEKPKAAPQHFVGPVLPSAVTAGAPPEPPRATAPPTFDFEGLAPAKRPPMAKSAPPIEPPRVEEKVPGPEKGSRLIAENFGEKPATLVNDPAVQPASVSTIKAKTPAEAAPAGKAAEAPSPPWLPLTITLLVLFASLGGNIFLGWIAHDARARCGLLLRQRRQMAGSSVPA